MNTAEIVIGEVKRDGGFQVRQLLAERISEPSHAPKLHPHGQVLPFHVRSADVFRIGIANSHLGYDLLDWAWGVPPLGAVILSIVAKQFHKLREIHVQAEAFRDASRVVNQAVCRKLHRAGKATVQVPQKAASFRSGALADVVGGNQLGLLVNGNENPLIADLQGFALSDASRLLLHEAPNLVDLKVSRAQIAHRGVHQAGTALTGDQEQTHDGIAVESCQSLCAADRAPLKQTLNCLLSRIGPRQHRVSRQSRVRLAKRGFAGSAAPALDSALTKVPKTLAVSVGASYAGHIGLVFLAGQADNEFASALRLTPRAEQPRFSVRAEGGALMCGGGGRAWTFNLPLSRRLLYPVELHPHEEGIQGFASLNARRLIDPRWVSHGSCPFFLQSIAELSLLIGSCIRCAPKRVFQEILVSLLSTDHRRFFFVQVVRVGPDFSSVFPKATKQPAQGFAVLIAEQGYQLLICTAIVVLKQSVYESALIAINQPEKLSDSLFSPSRGTGRLLRILIAGGSPGSAFNSSSFCPTRKFQSVLGCLALNGCIANPYAVGHSIHTPNTGRIVHLW